MVKAVFRYILTYETPEGATNIVEFSNEAEYLEFKEELSQQNISSRLINARKMAELMYKNANHIDMRG